MGNLFKKTSKPLKSTVAVDIFSGYLITTFSFLRSPVAHDVAPVDDEEDFMLDSGDVGLETVMKSLAHSLMEMKSIHIANQSQLAKVCFLRTFSYILV